MDCFEGFVVLVVISDNLGEFFGFFFRLSDLDLGNVFWGREEMVVGIVVIFGG